MELHSIVYLNMLIESQQCNTEILPYIPRALLITFIKTFFTNLLKVKKTYLM